jgi:outer membrane protein OmpA-like peptidoglycan-associated protein/opacity protein-like surface antigen
MIATAAVAVFLMPAFLLRADDAAKPSTGAGGDKAATSSTEPFVSMPADSPGDSTPYRSNRNIGTPKVELFLGYSYVRALPELAAGNRLVWLNGGSASIAYNINRYFGIVADIGDYTNSEIRFQGTNGITVDVDNANGGVLSYLFGPRLSFRNHGRVTPFVQALFGGAHASNVVLTGCTLNCTILPTEDTFAWTAGGGLDIKVRRHIAIRLIQAEYLMTRFQDYSTGVTASQNDMRLSSGIVFRFGGNAAPQLPPAPVTYSCSVSPTSVFPGEPIAASGTALNLNPAKTAVYTWHVDGGTVTGVSSTAKIDTTNLAPGAYTLKCHVSEGGMLSENADATAAYAVKAFEPPTISCTANPSTISIGDKSVITAAGASPQNRPLTYSYAAQSGIISGAGASATFDSTGAPTGTVGITCNVTDDKGQSATAGTSVTITAPLASAEVQQLETRLVMRSVFFQTDEPRIEKPNGGLLASQEKTLTTLATDFKRYLELKPDAYLTLTGHTDVRGSVEYNQTLSERRVSRVKLFLVDQGVPEAKIKTLSLGKEDELTTAQVEEAIKQNPELTAADREELLNELPVFVLAKNRRVDVTLSTTGQQSTRWYPFNAADFLPLLDRRNLTPGNQDKNATPKK